MPNHITQRLSAIGTPEGVARFVEKARGPLPLSGNNPEGRWARRPDKQLIVEPFSFHALRPLPEAYFTSPYDPVGIDLQRELWGVKWGAYEQGEPEVELGIATYHFQTAWSPCVEFINNIQEDWPDLVFLLSWGGEGPCRGWALWRDPDGSIFEDDYKDWEHECPDYDGEDEEEERLAYQRYAWARDKFLRDHPVRAARALARFPDDADGILCDWLYDHGYHRLRKEVLRCLSNCSATAG